jgi:hypothetical protein
MSLDRILRAADRGRRAAAAVGVRPFTVTVRIERYSGSIGHGVTLQSTSSVVTLDPAPKVVQLGGEQAMFYGAGELLAESTGESRVTVYRIGPITPAFTGGGYTMAQLLPVPADDHERAVVLLTGPGFAAGGEPFKVIEHDASDATEIYLVVKRVPRIA